MRHSTLVKALSSYSYDKKFYEEKSREIDKLKVQLQNNLDRILFLKKLNLIEDEHKVAIRTISKKLFEEEKILLQILEKKQKIEQSLNLTEQPYKSVLYYRYILSKSFDEIGQMMNYSTKRIYQLHSEGLDIFSSMDFDFRM